MDCKERLGTHCVVLQCVGTAHHQPELAGVLQEGKDGRVHVLAAPNCQDHARRVPSAADHLHLNQGHDCLLPGQVDWGRSVLVATRHRVGFVLGVKLGDEHEG